QRHDPSRAHAGLAGHPAASRSPARQSSGPRSGKGTAGVREEPRGPCGAGDRTARPVSDHGRRAPREDDIRRAMERLLAGRAVHTDGALDATTLAAEAGVSRQDLYRTYRPILDEF